MRLVKKILTATITAALLVSCSSTEKENLAQDDTLSEEDLFQFFSSYGFDARTMQNEGWVSEEEMICTYLESEPREITSFFSAMTTETDILSECLIEEEDHPDLFRKYGYWTTVVGSMYDILEGKYVCMLGEKDNVLLSEVLFDENLLSKCNIESEEMFEYAKEISLASAGLFFEDRNKESVAFLTYERCFDDLRSVQQTDISLRPFTDTVSTCALGGEVSLEKADGKVDEKNPIFNGYSEEHICMIGESNIDDWSSNNYYFNAEAISNCGISFSEWLNIFETQVLETPFEEDRKQCMIELSKKLEPSWENLRPSMDSFLTEMREKC